MTSHEYYQCNPNEQLRFIEINKRKLHLSAVILGLKVKLLFFF